MSCPVQWADNTTPFAEPGCSFGQCVSLINCTAVGEGNGDRKGPQTRAGFAARYTVQENNPLPSKEQKQQMEYSKIKFCINNFVPQRVIWKCDKLVFVLGLGC